MKKKILSVFGTRPEAIKMSPLVLALEKHPAFNSVVCVTAQHREMLDHVLTLFNLPIRYDLNMMGEGQDLTDITSKILVSLRDILRKEQPDIVLVHGDTTTSFAASLASFYAEIPIGHVEAGLRTYNIKSPYPEEANRQLTGRLSTIHFAPTKLADQNLLKELVDPKKVVVTGNTVVDALFMALEKINSNLKHRTFFDDSVTILLNNNSPILLVTGHRRESFGQGFLNICEALKQIAINNPKLHIIYPVHLNPNVQEPVYHLLDGFPNIHLLPPLDYLPFVTLLNSSTIVLTDSGGIQEEAPSLGKPVLVMRETTERPEAIEAGTVKLVGTNTNTIVDAVHLLLEDKIEYEKMSKAHNPYGDGNASQRIIEVLLSL